MQPKQADKSKMTKTVAKPSKPPMPAPPPAGAEVIKPVALGNTSDEDLMRRLQFGQRKCPLLDRHAGA